eukprot:COSAG01_NODE_29399_length_638_cov_2.549165_2_plen_85_part_00
MEILGCCCLLLFMEILGCQQGLHNAASQQGLHNAASQQGLHNGLSASRGYTIPRSAVSYSRDTAHSTEAAETRNRARRRAVLDP